MEEWGGREWKYKSRNRQHERVFISSVGREVRTNGAGERGRRSKRERGNGERERGVTEKERGQRRKEANKESVEIISVLLYSLYSAETKIST